MQHSISWRIQLFWQCEPCEQYLHNVLLIRPPQCLYLAKFLHAKQCRLHSLIFRTYETEQFLQIRKVVLDSLFSISWNRRCIHLHEYEKRFSKNCECFTTQGKMHWFKSASVQSRFWSWSLRVRDCSTSVWCILPMDSRVCFQFLGVARTLIPFNSFATSVASAFSAGLFSYWSIPYVRPVSKMNFFSSATLYLCLPLCGTKTAVASPVWISTAVRTNRFSTSGPVWMKK